MKKSTRRKNAQPVLCNEPGRDTDFAALRQRIRNRIGQEALGMVDATIDAVNNGQYAALKYLFEAVGLFPANIQDDAQQEDVLTPRLLQALGLPEVRASQNAITKDSAQH